MDKLKIPEFSIKYSVAKLSMKNNLPKLLIKVWEATPKKNRAYHSREKYY